MASEPLLERVNRCLGQLIERCGFTVETNVCPEKRTLPSGTASHSPWPRDGPNTAGVPAGSDEATHLAGQAGPAADRQSITRASWPTRS